MRGEAKGLLQGRTFIGGDGAQGAKAARQIPQWHIPKAVHRQAQQTRQTALHHHFTVIPEAATHQLSKAEAKDQAPGRKEKRLIGLGA